MDAFVIEDKKFELENKLNETNDPVNSFLLIYDFLRFILKFDNIQLRNPYFIELSPLLIGNLKSIKISALDPSIIKNKLVFLHDNAALFENSGFDEEIRTELQRLFREISDIEASLRGDHKIDDETIPSFPILVKYDEKLSYGEIKTFKIKIEKSSAKQKNTFLIVPSIKDLESRLENQVNISWNIALEYLKQFYNHPYEFHEVVIILNHKFADIEGYSLGLSLTIGFIQALFKFYNTPLSLSLKENITFTGGIDETGRIKNSGKNIIQSKTEAVFFSNYNYFALPLDDLNFAVEKLETLRRSFPKRDLRLIGVGDFDDLINDRRILKISKATLIERSAKYIKNNKAAVILAFAIIIFTILFSLFSIDNNPHTFKIVNQTVHVVNKHGKILWSTKQPFSTSIEKVNDEPYVHRIFDINDDGMNEVILAYEFFPNIDTIAAGRVACFNNSGELIWKYQFRDKVPADSGDYDVDNYYVFLVDIVKEGSKNILVCNARHYFYPSAIFKLDLANGKRVEGTLWSQGHFVRGLIGDFNNDDKREIFIGGVNNGMESAFALLMDYDDLNGQTPSSSKYLFKDLEIAPFIKYLLLNKSDIAIYKERRFNSVIGTQYDKNTGELLVNTFEAELKQRVGFIYRFDNKMENARIQIGDEFQFPRDSLIIKGLLKGPLTDDPEYSKRIIGNIKEWNGSEFVPFLRNQ
jgi:hypothetical protein